MNEAEYLKLKEQIIANATRRREQIEAEKRKQLESLEMIWELVSSMNGQSPSVNTSEIASQIITGETSAGTFPLAEAVRLVLPAKGHIFDINNIIRSIETKGHDVKKPINPTSVSGVLRKLQAASILEIVKAGKGKRPSRYRVAEAHGISSESGQSVSA